MPTGRPSGTGCRRSLLACEFAAVGLKLDPLRADCGRRSLFRGLSACRPAPGARRRSRPARPKLKQAQLAEAAELVPRRKRDGRARGNPWPRPRWLSLRVATAIGLAWAGDRRLDDCGRAGCPRCRAAPHPATIARKGKCGAGLRRPRGATGAGSWPCDRRAPPTGTLEPGSDSAKQPAKKSRAACESVQLERLFGTLIAHATLAMRDDLSARLEPRPGSTRFHPQRMCFAGLCGRCSGLVSIRHAPISRPHAADPRRRRASSRTAPERARCRISARRCASTCATASRC